MTARSIVPQNYKVQENVTIEEFGTGWVQTGTLGNGNISDDAVNFLHGTSALKASVTVAGAEVQVDKTVDIRLTKNIIFSINLFLHDTIDKYLGTYIYLTSSNYSTYFQLYISPSYLTQGWNRFIVHGLDAIWTNVGGESWSNKMTKMRVRTVSSAGNTSAMTFGGIDYGIDFKPSVVIRFDDAKETVYTQAFPYMQSKGIKGITYANGSLVGTTNFCTLAQLKEMEDAGWDIGNHTYSHANFTAMTAAEVQADIDANTEYLQNNGFKAARHFAIPFGIDNVNSRAGMTAAQLTTICTSIELPFYPHEFTPIDSYIYTRTPLPLISQDAQRIPAHAVENVHTLQSVKDWVNAAIQKHRSTVLMFHEINDAEATTYDWSNAKFQGLCDFLVERKINVVTMSEFYDGLTNPRKLVSRV